MPKAMDQGTPLYDAWGGMRRRCNNPKCHNYKDYGGRGIKVCPQWSRYTQFKKDMGSHPGKGWTLDRINTDGDYEPGNVRWATMKTQSRNKRNNQINKHKANKIIAMHKRGKIRQCVIAAKFGIDYRQVHNIINGYIWR